MALTTLGLFLAACLGSQDAPAEQPSPRVLFLTHSAGFVHSVVRRPEDGSLAHAERALVAAAGDRMQVDCTQDCSEVFGGGLEDYDAVVFYTTGELPSTPEQREGLLAWIRGGGAFIGVHCATDTFYEFKPYQQMIGGVFNGHPWHEEVDINVEDTDHPATCHLGEKFRITDEIYQFRDYSRYPLHVLASLDGEAVDLSRGARGDDDYALSWCKPYGQGHVFYTALGHREDVWEDDRFLEHLMAGIEWAIDGPAPMVPPPAGATVLFDGVDSQAGWTTRREAERLMREGAEADRSLENHGGEPSGWRVEGNEFVVVPGTGDSVSRMAFDGDFLLHVEFQVPPTPETNGWQARGNSGVYVQGRYEVQVLDSLGREMRAGDCGAIYGKHIPPVDACRPAGTWQSYDIEFRSPRFDPGSGNKTENARMTVWQNGVLLHDDVEVDGPTAASMGGPEIGFGPLLLQDHGHPVRYRNIWLLAR